MSARPPHRYRGRLGSPRPSAPQEKGGKGRVLVAPLRTRRSPAPLGSLLRSRRPLARRHRIDAAPALGSPAATRFFPSAPGSHPRFHGSSPQPPVLTPAWNGSPSSRYTRPSAAGFPLRYGREEGEGRLGQAARWNDSSSPPPHPDPPLRAAAGTARPRRGPSPLSLQGRSSASLPLVRSRRPRLRSGLSSFSRVRPARAAALLRRRERRARRCLRPGSAAPAARLSCPASRGGSLAPSSLNFASLRAVPAPPRHKHQRRRSPPRPRKGSAALPPHALPRCRDGGQLPAQGRAPVPAPREGPGRPPPISSCAQGFSVPAPGHGLFDSNPVPWAVRCRSCARASPGPGSA